MNKEKLEEVIKIMGEPITVNSIDYKYFTQEQYNRLISVYENAQWLVDFAKAQTRYIENLQQKVNQLETKIDKAIVFICNKNLQAELTDECSFSTNDLLEILKGGSNE